MNNTTLNEVSDLIDAANQGDAVPVVDDDDEDISDDDFVMTDYAELGKVKSKATIQGKSSGQVHYLAFLRTRHHEPLFTSWTQFPEDVLCSETNFRKYGTYLCKVAKSKKGKFFKCWTAVQYLSAAVDAVSKKFPDNMVIKIKNWYKELRDAMIQSISLRHIQEGELVKVI